MGYLLKANAVVILFYLCYKLFLQKETFFESNRYFLLAGLIIASIIPLITIPIYIEVSSQLDPVNFITTTNAETTALTTEAPFNYSQLLKWGYFIGIVLLSIKFIIECISLSTLLAKNKKTKKEGYFYIETKKDHSPFSFFKYIVYNPSHFNMTELEQVILHEKIHAEQYHSLDVIFTKIASILFWFNPFIWLYNKSLHQNLEFIVDNTVQQKTTNIESYQTLLLKTAFQQQQIALVNNFNNSLIKKRIIMLNKSKSKSLNLWKYTLIVPVLALFLMSCNTKETYIEEESHVTIIENKIPLDGNDGYVAKEDAIDIIITSNSTDDDLKKTREYFAKYDADVTFGKVKRNDKGEIVYLHISYKTPNQKLEGISTGGKNPIVNIPLVYNKLDKTVNIGDLAYYHVYTKSYNSKYF